MYHLICRTRVNLRAKVFPHVSHLNSFLPVCTLKRKKLWLSVISNVLIISRWWSPHVLDKMRFSWKCFPTRVTREKFFSCVHTKRKKNYYIIVRNVLIISCWSPHMSDKIPLLSKWFSTMFTIKLFLTCVHTKKKENYNSKGI